MWFYLILTSYYVSRCFLFLLTGMTLERLKLTAMGSSSFRGSASWAFGTEGALWKSRTRVMWRLIGFSDSPISQRAWSIILEIGQRKMCWTGTRTRTRARATSKGLLSPKLSLETMRATSQSFQSMIQGNPLASGKYGVFSMKSK